MAWYLERKWFLEHLLLGLQDITYLAKIIDFKRLSVDSFFSAEKGEEEEIVPLIKKIKRWLAPLIERGIVPILEADKG
jgi:hypothetical protein